MHAEKRVLPYTPEQLYELVRNVEKYPEFLPWCQALRIRRRDSTETSEILIADMVIGFKVFRERFTSRVEAFAGGKDSDTTPRIDVAYTEGPFKFLNNHWVFNAIEGGTEIDFFVDFEFRAKILEKAIGVVFNEAVQKMVNAFEERAAKTYGKPE